MAKEDHDDLKNISFRVNAVEDLSRRISYNDNSDPITAAEAKNISAAVYAFNQKAYDLGMKTAYAAIRKAAQEGKNMVSLSTNIWYNGTSDARNVATFKAASEQLIKDGYSVKYYTASKLTEVVW